MLDFLGKKTKKVPMLKSSKKLKIITAFLFFPLFFLSLPEAKARIIFVDDVFENDSEIYEIGTNDDATLTPLSIQFGGINSESISWDTNKFSLSDDLSLSDNEIIDARIENVSSLPGGALGLGLGGEGRIVILDTIDNIAPGCTISPFCSAGTYIWDGSGWVNLSGATTASGLTKVVTVGASGADYTTIEAAANYLQTRSGGIMLLDSETHIVTTPVDLQNTTVIGKDASNTTIEISGSGELNSFDTVFKFLTLDVNAITNNYAIDIQTGASSLVLEFVDINIQDLGDSLIDSAPGAPPIAIIKVLKSNFTGGSGTIVKNTASDNLDDTSTVLIDATSGNNPLEFENWNVTMIGGGNVKTTGIITPVPADTIFVHPNMNIQTAINSLELVGNGGTITLLPGTHSISSTISIEDDNIEIRGLGDASIIQTNGTFSGITNTTAAIQIGAEDGSAPVDGVVLRDFRVEVQNDSIHGIRSAGGNDNRIENLTVIKTAGTSGSGSTTNIGIQFIDGTGEPLIRPVIRGNRVLGSGGSIHFTDGIHVSSDGDITGVFGNGQGVNNALVDGNNVDYVGETGFVFIGVNDSSLFNNRASRTGVSGGYGIFMGNVNNINMTANVFTNSLSAGSIAIGIEDFNTGTIKSTTNSIFVGNVIDGTANGGVGFSAGLQIGATSNTNVHQNIFQNNVIAGAATGTTTAIDLQGNADNNTFSDNTISGGTNAWDTGISLESSTQDGNVVQGNRFINTAAQINDQATATRLTVQHHRSIADPTINDDINDGYEIGTLWINTTSDTSFVLVDSSAGAAVWQATGGGGSNTNNIFYTYDNTGGQTINGTEITLNWDNVTETIIDSDYTFNAGANTVEMNTTGLYKITVEVGTDDINTTGGARSTNEIRIQEDPLGAGSFTDIPGAYTNCYHRETTENTCSVSIIRSFTATDEVRVRLIRKSGSTNMQTEADASHILIERIR